MAKKVDTKKVAKNEVFEKLMDLLKREGYDLKEGTDYGFKSNSIVMRGVNGHDVRIDLTTPKAGMDNYDAVLEAFEAEAEAE